MRTLGLAGRACRRACVAKVAAVGPVRAVRKARGIGSSRASRQARPSSEGPHRSLARAACSHSYSAYCRWNGSGNGYEKASQSEVQHTERAHARLHCFMSLGSTGAKLPMQPMPDATRPCPKRPCPGVPTCSVGLMTMTRLAAVPFQKPASPYSEYTWRATAC